MRRMRSLGTLARGDMMCRRDWPGPKSGGITCCSALPRPGLFDWVAAHPTLLADRYPSLHGRYNPHIRTCPKYRRQKTTVGQDGPKKKGERTTPERGLLTCPPSRCG